MARYCTRTLPGRLNAHTAVPSGYAQSLGVERLLIDVFAKGKLMTVADARALVQAHVGWRDAFVSPCSAHDVWLRMLRNLVHVAQSARGPTGSALLNDSYGLLLAWASTSAQQRRAHAEADLNLRGRIIPDLLELAADPEHAGLGLPLAEARPSAAERRERGGVAQPARQPWPVAAVSVTEALGLWAPRAEF
jgi:hypothetical protein